MSTTIDSRVVEMQFNNSQFESNVKTSMDTLEKLKQSLNLEGATKGLENVNSAIKNCDMSGLTSAVETVHAKFSAFEVMAVTALANITNSVINTGKQMLASLTIEPISQGFEEYELKMGSIQTIMASTGATLEEVNGYLDELNTYADKTIYSFADMTTNIGKFTNAGVGLEDAVMAIKGVSNEAAVSGANANEASRAMYNFAQALSAGYVKLIDWKSIENANMATVEFKTQLLESAVACGTLEKTADGMYQVLSTNANGSTMSEAIDATHNFNDSLSYQWMTTEALVNTLKDYADENTEIGKKAYAAAQDVKTFTQLMDTLAEAVGSGWAQTWEILFGDFEEAKSLWTDVSNVVGGFIDTMSDARNSMLQGWKDLGGRTALIDALKNAFDGLVSVVTPITEAFRDIFPATTAEQLYNMTVSLKEFTSHLKLSDTASENLKNTFKGLFSILDIVKQAFSAVLSAITPLFSGLSSLSGGILTVTGSIGEWLTQLDEFIKQNDIFGKAIQSVIGFVKDLANSFKNFALEVKDTFNLPDLDTLKNSLREFIEMVSEKFATPGFDLLQTILEKLKEKFSELKDAAGNVKDFVIGAFEAIADAIVNCKILDVIEAIWNGLKTIASVASEIIGTIAGSLGNSLASADFGSFFDIIAGLISGGVLLKAISFINELKESFSGFSELLGNVSGVLDSVRGSLEAWQSQLKAGTLLKIAAAIGVLTVAIIALTGVDSEKLGASLGSITVLFADLMAAMTILDKIGGFSSSVAKASTVMIAMSSAIYILASAMKKLADLDWEGIEKGLVGITGLAAVVVASSKAMSSNTGQLITGATGLIAFAAAIKVLASACQDLSTLSWDELTKGLTGVGVLLAEVDVFLNTAKFSSGALTTATGILVLSEAITVLASACQDFGNMNWEEISKGLVSIGALLTEITAFTNLTGNAEHVVATGLALVEIAAGMKIFASAMTTFGSMEWESIGKGLTAMGGALAEVAVAVNLMPNNMISIGSGLVVVGGALEIISDVLSKMGGLTWDEIAKGLTTLGVALTELTVALNLMTGTLSGSAALLVAAAAIEVLTPALIKLGDMDVESIIKSLATLAGTFTVIGVVAAVLTPLTTTILALSAAFVVLGVGITAIGAGLVTIGAGLTSLSVGFTSLAAGGAAAATAAMAALTTIIEGVAAMIPTIATELAEGVVEFAKVITTGAPAITEAFAAICQSLVTAMVSTIPSIVEGVATLLVEVLGTISAYAPQIVQTALDILVSILQGIANNISNVVQAAVDIIVGFLDGITQKLPDVIQAGVDLIIAFMEGISSAIPQLVNAGFQLIIDFINSMADSMEANIPLLMAAVTNLVTSILTGIVNGLGAGVEDCVDTGVNLMLGFIEGIESTLGKIVDAALGVVKGAVDAVKDFLGIHSPSTLMAEVGENTGEGFINGLDDTESDAEEAGEDLATAAYSGLLDGIESGSKKTNAAMKAADTQAVNEKSDYWNRLIAIVENGSIEETALNNQNVSDQKAVNEETASLHTASIEEENRYWDELLAAKKNGEEQEKYQSMSMSEFRQDILSQTIEILKEYTDALQSNTDSLMNNSGIFSEVSEQEAVSADTLTKNLEDQIEQLEEYGDVMASLNSRIADGGLKDAINQMGVDSLAELQALNGMTDDELNNYVGLYDQKYAMCQQVASQQLTGLQTETETKLSQLYGGAEVNLQQFAQSFDGTFESIRSYVGESITIGSQLATGVAEGITAGTEQSKQAAVQMITDTEEAAKQAADINSPSGVFRDNVGKNITAGIAEGMVADEAKSEIQASVEEINQFTLESFTESSDDFVEVGVGIIESYKEGISNSTGELTAQCEESMTAALTQMQTVITNSQSTFQAEAANIITSFISGVQSKSSETIATITELTGNMLEAIQSRYSEFNSVGVNCMTKFITGIKSKQSEAKSTITTIVTNMLTAIQSKYSQFNSVGTGCMERFIAGIESKESETVSLCERIVSSCVSALEDEYDGFYDAGANLAEGFKEGILSKAREISRAAAEIAREAMEAVEDELDEHSPSKEMMKRGQYFSEGFAAGIEDETSSVTGVAKDMADSALSTVSDAILALSSILDNGIDTEPTIRPVLDLSNVESGMGVLNTLFARNQVMAISNGMDEMPHRSEIQNDEPDRSSGNTYQFTQNNYSPKALSRVEIYRQTKNQFSAMERMVEA